MLKTHRCVLINYSLPKHENYKSYHRNLHIRYLKCVFRITNDKVLNQLETSRENDFSVNLHSFTAPLPKDYYTHQIQLQCFMKKTKEAYKATYTDYNEPIDFLRHLFKKEIIVPWFLSYVIIICATNT